jgi:hypothetical protein
MQTIYESKVYRRAETKRVVLLLLHSTRVTLCFSRIRFLFIRFKDARHVDRNALTSKPRPLLNLSFRKLPLTLLPHHPGLDDIHQTFNLLPCIPRMQADPYPLTALWYGWRYDATHHEALSLTVRGELFRCGREE